MGDVVRVEFEERDQQWRVTLADADGEVLPGRPFPAYGGEGDSKLEQVLGRLMDLGYQPARIPYNQPNATRYAFEVSRF